VSLAEQVKNLYYKINSGSYSKLCIGCNKYAGTKSFSEGQNNLTIRAVTNTNQTYLSSITFNTDTIKPKISSTYPSTSYGSGLFGVKYIEANLKNVTLFYGLNSANPEKKKELIGCSSGTNMWCYNNVDLSAYNGKYIYYKFEVRDNFFSVNSSARKILVDTIKPIMNVNKPENNTVYINKDGKVYINITSNEKSKLEYKDNNLAWISLCSSCIYYRNYKTFSFGQHNVSFKATDLAGNYDEKSVSFKLQQY